MKKLLALLVLLPCLALAAGTLGALKEIEKTADAGDMEMGNGGVYLSKYDVEEFDLAAAVAEVKKEIRRETGAERHCRFKVFTGRREAIDMIASNEWTKSPKVAAILRRLYDADQIKAIVTKAWDEASGDSEFCAIFQFDVYTTDGNKLTLDYQITD
jgi:hypothetical protein